MSERIVWWLVCALVLTMPWEKSVYVPQMGTITRVIGIAAFVGWIGFAIQSRAVRRPNLAVVTAAVFVVWAALTWFWTYDRQATAARAFTFVQLLAMVYMIWDLCRTEERKVGLMRAYVAGAAVASVATLLQYVQHLQTYYRRYAAPGFDPNDLGLTVALSIPLALYLALAARTRTFWLYYAGVVLAGSAILLTASRSALIAAYAAFLVVFVTWRVAGTVQRVAGVAFFLLFAIATAWLAPAASRQRIATLGAELTQGTLHNRTRIWKAGVKAFRQRPIRGVGAGAYPDAVKPWLGVPGIVGHEYVAHNTFLSVLVETGLVGFALFGGLLVTLMLFVYVMPDVERGLWALMLAVWAIGVCTLTWEQRKPTWLLFALIMSSWARAWAGSAPAYTRRNEEPAR